MKVVYVVYILFFLVFFNRSILI